VGDHPFFLTLGPHAFYWFSLEPAEGRSPVALRERQPRTIAATSLSDLLQGGPHATLERELRDYLLRQRWFRGKARKLRATSIVEVIPLTTSPDDPHLLLVRVDYVDGEPETYVLPIGLVESTEATSQHLICGVQLRGASRATCVIDAAGLPQFGHLLFELIRNKRRAAGEEGVLQGASTGAFQELMQKANSLKPALVEREQSNTSIAFGTTYILKLYRKLEEGVGLDLEIGKFLTAHGFPHSPAVAGALDYRREDDIRTVAVLHAFARNEGDAWQYTRDHVSEFFERASTFARPATAVDTSTSGLLRLAEQPDAEARQLIGTYIEDAVLIGRRTAELHNVLGSAADDPAFAPEPFSGFYQRSLYQTMRNLSGRVLQLLERQAGTLQGESQDAARAVLESSDHVLQRLRAIISQPLNGLRIRCHGDYHLGQLLYTGKDFVVTDFEGEPLHPLSERRMKRTPLRDVAGMLRSFHYAAQAPLVISRERQALREEDLELLQSWSRFWYANVAAAFLEGHLQAVDPRLLPVESEQRRIILDCYLIEKAIYEIGYELNNRSEWLIVPLRGLLDLVEAP
jgi:maltose alpha-D-glucosyltransferase / alpha-amylase